MPRLGTRITPSCVRAWVRVLPHVEAAFSFCKYKPYLSFPFLFRLLLLLLLFFLFGALRALGIRLPPLCVPLLPFNTNQRSPESPSSLPMFLTFTIH